MDNKEADIGLIGLGVMGRNLALNMGDHGFGVIGLDLQKEKVRALNDEADSPKISGTDSVDNLVSRLKKPRAVLLLVPAGEPVDSVIGELKERLDSGDVIIDGGNSHFTDTDRRAGELAARKIDFLGMGISGGSEGARHGPSMMPGGPRDTYNRLRAIFEAVSARVEGDPCVTYLGPGSAGHYVKMVHNGIEYALMQVISEVYDILKRAGQLSNDDMASVFDEMNKGPLNSFLMEITAKILRVRDEDTSQRLIDMIMDAARQKGTGKWASQDAMELQVPIPTIDAAVSMRDLSGYKEERKDAAKLFPPSKHPPEADRKELVDRLTRVLRFAAIAAYAQGIALLRAASREYKYHLNFADIARIWRGGCIIRSRMLDDIRQVFGNSPDTNNIMTAEPFKDFLAGNRQAVCETLRLAADHEIAVPGFASVLAYFDGYRTFRLPANLIQAQRDYFGSHTYERIDREGTFHTEWT